MANILQGSDLEKLHELCEKPYAQQAAWFLNAFWNEYGEKEAENVWKWVELCHDLDDKKKEGNALGTFVTSSLLKVFLFLKKLIIKSRCCPI
tara:strand:+ start:191 stop:466 length:276 start_codon:yes stop_codon:yes gene_type:complete